MRRYIENFFKEYEYPQNAITELLCAYDRITSRHNSDFEALIAEYENSYDIDYGAAMDSMKYLSEVSGVHEYTGALLLFLCYTRGLRAYYEKQGISHEIFRDTVLDLRYKLDECICVKGICGSFVAKWFVGFFKLERFALGRLQFEVVEFGGEYERAGLSLSPTDRVLNVHIPRTGTRLDRDSVLHSYKLAADFYKPILGDKIVFVCSSWLLFPRHREMLSPTSNLLAFMNDFDIYTSGEYSGYSEVWRLFDKEYDGDVTHLPADSSLRRKYIELISQGEKIGWGKGVFEYKRHN